MQQKELLGKFRTHEYAGHRYRHNRFQQKKDLDYYIDYIHLL